MRSALVGVLALLVLAPAALADTTSTDSPRDSNLPPSQDFSHVSSTIDPVTGTWSVAYTFYGPPTSAAWGNLYARLYTGASQCADFQAQIAGFQQTPSIPGDGSVFGSVIPPPDRNLRAAESASKAFDGNTITLSMTDSSLVGAPATCVEAATGVVTLRQGGKQVGRASYTAKSGEVVTLRIKLTSAARRLLKRHRSLLVTLTATAQAGTQMATKAVHARVHR